MQLITKILYQFNEPLFRPVFQNNYDIIDLGLKRIPFCVRGSGNNEDN